MENGKLKIENELKRKSGMITYATAYYFTHPLIPSREGKSGAGNYNLSASLEGSSELRPFFLFCVLFFRW